MTNRNQRLEMMLQEYEREEDEKNLLSSQMDAQCKELTLKKEELEKELQRIHETNEQRVKTELNKAKLNFIDEIFHINSMVKRISLSISEDAPPKSLPENEETNLQALMDIVKENLSGVSKLVSRHIDTEKDRLGDTMREYEKNCNNDYQKFKDELYAQVDREKE